MLAEFSDFNVFQLLRLLDAGAAGCLPIEKRLRFKADLSSAFPGHEISRLSMSSLSVGQAENPTSEKRIEIWSANFCVASVLGPLPEPFTEWVRELAAERLPAMADFLDIFNQRVNLLRFELKQSQVLGLNNLAPEKTHVARFLSSVMGLANPEVSSQLALPPRGWLGLSGLIANHRKSVSSAQCILAWILKANVKITSFIGAWKKIESQDVMRLGVFNHKLGHTSVLGEHVWDQHARVRIEISSLSYEKACQILPPNQLETLAAMASPKKGVDSIKKSSHYFLHFANLITLLFDHLVDCEIIINVVKGTIPRAQLITQERMEKEENNISPQCLRLGQTSWLQPVPNEKNCISYLLSTDDLARVA